MAKAASSKASTAKAKHKTLVVTLVRSLAKRLPNHLANARGLGLKRLHQSVRLADTPEIRGMINKIDYLVKVEEA